MKLILQILPNIINFSMNRKVSVAPMMDCTDRHGGFF